METGSEQHFIIRVTKYHRTQISLNRFVLQVFPLSKKTVKEELKETSANDKRNLA
jgi:hypothetical protein